MEAVLQKLTAKKDFVVIQPGVPQITGAFGWLIKQAGIHEAWRHGASDYDRSLALLTQAGKLVAEAFRSQGSYCEQIVNNEGRLTGFIYRVEIGEVSWEIRTEFRPVRYMIILATDCTRQTMEVQSHDVALALINGLRKGT